MEEPCERHLGRGNPASRRDLHDALDDRQVELVVVELARVVVVLRACGLLRGHARARPGQESARERAPRDDAQALGTAERQHLALLLAVHEVVVVLHGREAMPAAAVGEAERPRELPGVHARGSDVARLARAHDAVQSLERLLERGVGIEAVDLVEVHIVHAEPPQGGVDGGEDVLAR